TSITNGVVEDTSGNLWNLPASVEIPISGTVSVTVTAQQPGTISAAADSISEINTPTRGWQSVTNPLAAAPGAPIESDAALRQRQAASTSLPAQTPFQTIVANVGEISGIGRYKGYQNDTGSPDANGIPGHSIALVVEGGDATTIAQTIEAKKSPGTGTYGTTSIVVLDPSGVPVTIKFFVLSEIEIYLLVDITPQTGYVSTTGTALIKALAAYISAFGIGQSSILSKLDSPANLSGTAATSTSGLTQAQLEALSDTYDVESIYQARGDMTVIGGPYAAGATTINVANAANFANGQAIQITQSDGSMASGTVTGVSGAAVSFTPPIASGKTVVNGALAYVAGNLSVAFNEGGNCAVANITLTS
ncbi:MAG: baseplate J/gp47 family protein, partial [Janthinobacterium lividum]